MPDLDAIGEAIALRYTPANLTPPAGLPAIRSATADLPNQLGALPLVLIFPEGGELNPGNGTRPGRHTFLARLYLAETNDWPRHSKALRRWATKLLDVHGTVAALGGAVVIVRSVAWSIGSMRYEPDTYAGVEVRLEVITSESWTPSAT